MKPSTDDALPEVLKNRRLYLSLEVAALSGSRVLPVLVGLVVQLTQSRSFYLFSDPLQRLGLFTTAILTRRLSQDLPGIAVFLFVMFVSGDPWSQFGFRSWSRVKDGLTFAAASMGFAVIFYLPFSQQDIAHANRQIAGFYLSSIGPHWLIVLFCCMTAALAEVIYRGWLIPRLEELTGSTVLAVVAQALLYGLSFSTETLSGFVQGGLVALMTGLLFVKFRSVWPLIITHAIFNVFTTESLIQWYRHSFL